MKNINFYTMLVVVSALLMGCKPDNPNVYGKRAPEKPLQPIKYNGPTEIKADRPAEVVIPDDIKVTLPKKPADIVPERYVQGDQLPIKYNPKVDVLVVMDTSDSMYCDQSQLQKNIQKFANAFLQKQGRFLDFRIGVVSAWDSRFDAVAEQKKFNLGQLRPVCTKRQSRSSECSQVVEGVPYVTRETPDLVRTLGVTMSLGTETYDSKDAVKSGPEQEELFSPVIAALDGRRNDVNGGFRRPDAHLAVLFFSDTDDRTPDEIANGDVVTQMSAQQMTKFLKDLETPEATISAYAVLARYTDVINHQTKGTALREYPRAGMFQCNVNPVDPEIRLAGQGPFKMVQLLEQMKGEGFDLKDPNYGQKLGGLGESIVRKTLTKTIVLDYPPDLAQSIVVKYGKNQTIPKDDFKGWKYKATRDDSGKVIHTITINGGTVLEPEEDASLTIEYTK